MARASLGRRGQIWTYVEDRIEPTEFAGGLNLENERKRGVKEDFIFSCCWFFKIEFMEV